MPQTPRWDPTEGIDVGRNDVLSLTGANRIAGHDVVGTGHATRSSDPATGELSPTEYRDASPAQIDQAVQLAAASTEELRRDRRARAGLLAAIADGLEDDADGLVAVARDETGLPTPRLHGEVGRSAAQFRAFARVVEEGTYLEAHIDGAGTTADIRRILRPLGPVVVFGASNFPFAFSVAGGDTASALAAGCPVVVKAHPAHPGTSERSARVIEAAIADSRFPPGVFTLVHGADPRVGQALVTHALVEAVGFTGSYRGGRALFDAAAARPCPIPVYAEMGSTNPVFVTPAAVAERGAQIADELAVSITLGMGQFCTKPGLIVIPRAGSDDFLQHLARSVASVEPHPMLSAGIRDAFARGVAQAQAVPGVDVLVEGGSEDGVGVVQHPTLLATDYDTFHSNEPLHEERFGPFALAVRADADQYASLARQLQGVLVASVYAEDSDHPRLTALWDALEEVAGRLVVDQVPTGVAVVPAMHHGGPYPASTSSLHTSVGATAIRRFLRPVAYQNVPDALLPDELQDGPSPPLWRSIDGELTRAGVFEASAR